MFEDIINKCIRDNSVAFSNLTPDAAAAAGAALDVVACALGRMGNICPDDVGLIKSTQGSGMATATTTAPLAPGDALSLDLPPLGLMYCLNFGLEVDNAGAFATYNLEVVRSGVIVATLNRAMLAAGTANSSRAAACPCNICVGAIQTLTLRWRNTGAVPIAAGVTVGVQLCRTFNGDCEPKAKACGGC